MRFLLKAGSAVDYDVNGGVERIMIDVNISGEIEEDVSLFCEFHHDPDTVR